MIPFICLSIKYTPRGLRSTTFPGIQTPRVPDQYRTASPTAYSGRPALASSSEAVAADAASKAPAFFGEVADAKGAGDAGAGAGAAFDALEGDGTEQPMNIA